MRSVSKNKYFEYKEKIKMWKISVNYEIIKMKKK